LSGGTANGVAYLNGSKVVTTGSALTFDGTNLNLLTTNGKVRITPPTTTNYALTQASNAGGGFYTGIEDSTGSLFTGTAYAGVVWHTGNYPIAFGVNNSEQMRLTSTGLGIGTSSPAAKLHSSKADGGYVFAVSGTTKGMRVSTDANQTLLQGVDNTLTGSYQPLTLGGSILLFQTNGTTEAMRLDSSGNLGLGVTPSAWAAKGFQISSVTSVAQDANGYASFTNNAYNDTGSSYKYLTSSYQAALYRQAAGVHAWFNAPSGTAGNAITFTQAMTLDASGRLLIGNTTNSNGEALQIDANGVGSTLYTALFRNTSTSTSVYNAVRFLQGASGSAIGYIGTGGSAVANAAFANNFVVGTQSSSALVFNTNDTERARIDSSGNLLVGVTSGTRNWISKDNAGGYALTINNSNANPIGAQIYHNTDSNGTGNQFLDCQGAANVRAQIRSNGGIANYQANNVNLSDRREKTNFALAGEYLSKICAIPVQTFNYVDQNLEDDPGLTLGVVAQDVQAVAPELVSESNWGTEEEPKMRLSIYQTDLQYALMKALQELKAEFDAYKATHP
jgi:hypothetical protein